MHAFQRARRLHFHALFMLPVTGGFEWDVWNMQILECVLLHSVYCQSLWLRSKSDTIGSVKSLYSTLSGTEAGQFTRTQRGGSAQQAGLTAGGQVQQLEVGGRKTRPQSLA